MLGHKCILFLLFLLTPRVGFCTQISFTGGLNFHGPGESVSMGPLSEAHVTPGFGIEIGKEASSGRLGFSEAGFRLEYVPFFRDGVLSMGTGTFYWPVFVRGFLKLSNKVSVFGDIGASILFVFFDSFSNSSLKGTNFGGGGDVGVGFRFGDLGVRTGFKIVQYTPAITKVVGDVRVIYWF